MTRTGTLSYLESNTALTSWTRTQRPCQWTLPITSQHALYELATQQVLTEIRQGNYQVCDVKPPVVSPFSVLPKPDGGIRLTHDGSQPAGNSMNDYATLEGRYRFETVDNATALMWPGYYMAKVDLKSAYRSVPISKHS